MANKKLIPFHQKLSRYPLGQWLFSAFCARHAPYFKTVKPLIHVMKKNHCEVLVKKRRSVENHIGTLHVIAIINGLEMAMGFLAESSIPDHLRWIPKGMMVDYTSKADSDINCIAKLDEAQWQVGEVLVPIVARDTSGADVVRGAIKLWVTEKPAKQ